MGNRIRAEVLESSMQVIDLGKHVIARAIAGWLILSGLVGCEPQPTVAPPTVEAPVPPPPPRGSFLAQLSPDQTAQLNQLGVEVVVPGVIPPGFQVAAIETDDAGYQIAYRDDANRCFAIEFAQTPPESPATEQQVPTSPPLFQPDQYNLNYDLPADRPSRLSSDWLPGSQGAYRLVGSPEINSLQALSSCQNVDPQTAVQIVESLTIISSDIVGDGDAP